MKRISKIFIIIGIVSILGALGVLLYNIYSNKVSEENINEVIELINVSLEEEEEEIPVKKEYLTIKGQDYIGTIALEGSNKVLPINKEYSKYNLRYSPVVYYGSIEKNNLVVCAHNIKSQFGYLHQVKVGNKFVLTDANNNKYYYEVCEIEDLKSTSIEEMIKTDYDLTLFTCTYGGKTRLTIRLKRIN